MLGGFYKISLLDDQSTNTIIHNPHHDLEAQSGGIHRIDSMPFNLQNFRVLTTPPNSFLSFILAVAGDMCEYRVTNTCDNPASPSPNTTLDSALGMATQGEAFCVNDALCLLDDTDSTNPMYYCDCDGTGHEGKHCEYLLPEEVVPVPAGTPTASPTAKYTDTWSPTMLGSVTDQPTDEPSSGETVDSSKADDGLFMDGIDMGSSSEDSVNDDEDITAGVKFAISLGAILGVGLIGIVILLFRRRKKMVNQAVFQETQNQEFV